MKKLHPVITFIFCGLLALSTTACQDVWRFLTGKQEEEQPPWMRNVLAAEVRSPGTGRAAGAEISRLLARAAAVPGVEQVAVVDALPDATALRYQVTIEREGSPSGLQPAGYLHVVSPGYFATMKLLLIQGRFFNASDGEGSPLVVIVNESYARYKSGSSESPVGRRVRIGEKPDWLTIVGVVQDGPYAGDSAEIYVPYAQHAVDGLSNSRYVPPGAPPWYLLARVKGDQGAAIAHLRQVLGQEFLTLEERLKVYKKTYEPGGS